MSESDKEIARRTAAALAAIKQSLGEEDSAVSMFASQDLEELDAAYWNKHAGTAKPTPKQVVESGARLRQGGAGGGECGYWLLATGYLLLATCYWLLATGYWWNLWIILFPG